MCDSSTSLGIIIGAVGGAIASIVFWGFTWLHTKCVECCDGKKIYKWLSTHIPDKEGHKWRSTQVIASYTNLTQDRVRYICSIHEDICEMVGEENHWGIWGISRQKEESN